jgi:polyferredoxin
MLFSALTTDDYIVFNIVFIIFLFYIYRRTTILHKAFRYVLTIYALFFSLYMINAVDFINNSLIISFNYQNYNILPLKLSEFENIYIYGALFILGIIVYLYVVYRGD